MISILAVALAAAPAADGAKATEQPATATVKASLTVDGKVIELGHGFAYADRGVDPKKEVVVVVFTDVELGPAEQNNKLARTRVVSEKRLTAVEVWVDAAGTPVFGWVDTVTPTGTIGVGIMGSFEGQPPDSKRIAGKLSTNGTIERGSKYSYEATFDLPILPRTPWTSAADPAR